MTEPMEQEWKHAILQLNETRVWRTYRGGRQIDLWHGHHKQADSHFPEDWIASVTEGKNPGRESQKEGLSRVLNLPGQPYLKEVLQRQPLYYLGQRHVKKHGFLPGMLIKVIDAAERLTIQVHPDRAYARAFFSSDYGKTESWYILGTDQTKQACVYLGFRPGITRETWKSLFENQDIPGMLACLHRVPVKPGDVFMIEGGVPHAIGAGCFLIELQEPTDFTMRTELVTPSGLSIHENQCHQGVGYENMLQCFHYEGYDEDETCRRWKAKPCVLPGPEGCEKKALIDSRYTDIFAMNSLLFFGNVTYEKKDCLTVWTVISGSGILRTEQETVSVQPGDRLVLSAAQKTLQVSSETGLQIVECFVPV